MILESDDPWNVAYNTNLPQSGVIETTWDGAKALDETWFEKKEATWFAFVRNASAVDFDLRSANGIANVVTVDAAIPTAVVLTFAAGVSVGSIISIGDLIYYGLTPTFGGEVVGHTDTTVTMNPIGGGGSTPPAGSFIMFIKDGIAESHGVLGHYCTFTATNSQITATELFAVKSEVMKSYP